jgi:DNA polymerase III subunit delta
MIYVITGNDSSLLKREISKQVKEKLKEINDFNYISFDMYNHLIQDAIDSCTFSNLISEQKTVVCYNCYFLTDQAKPSASWNKGMDFDCLKKYVENQNPDCDLYLTSIGKLNGDSNKLVELLKKNAKIQTITTKDYKQLIDDGIAYVTQNGKSISKDAIAEVVKRVSQDYTLMINTLDKLMLYTSDIQLEDVYALVADKLEDTFFNIVNNLFKFNVKDAIKSFRDLLSKGNYPLTLFSQFSSQFEFLYEVSKMVELGYDDSKIAKELGCQPGRIYYSKKTIGNFRSKDILKMMADLNKAEIDMKYNLDNPNDVIELFILNFKKNYYRK